MNAPRRHGPRTSPDAVCRGSWREVDAVPIALPHLVVDVGPTGRLTVTLDSVPFPFPDGVPWTRSTFGELLDAVTAQRRMPVRVEVQEADGSTFTDIIRPRRPLTSTDPVPTSVSRAAPEAALSEITGAGFIPGEDVAVATVVTTTDAAGTGRVRALIDPRRIGDTGEVILFGRISGTILIQQLP